MAKKRLVQGVGVNDIDDKTVDKNRNRCIAYMKWKTMINRVYGKKALERNKNYVGMSCSEDFLLLSKFKAWYNNQIGAYQNGFELDKDLLTIGCKVYSEDTCCLIPKEVNLFMIARAKSSNRNLPTGVTYHKPTKKFKALLNVNGKRTTLGTFSNPDDAFSCYRENKVAQAKKLAEKWEGLVDDKVYQALLSYDVYYGEKIND